MILGKCEVYVFGAVYGRKIRTCGGDLAGFGEFRGGKGEKRRLLRNG